MTADFVGVLLLHDKVYPDAINELQYHVAKMQTKSEMNVKYAHAFFVHKQLIIKNCAIDEPKMAHFQDAFTDLYQKHRENRKTLP